MNEISAAANRTVTAYHEAAHAVAYIDRGLSFRYVTVQARYDVGRVALRRPRRVNSWVLTLIAAAGPIAQYHYANRHLDRALPDDADLEGEIAEAVEFAEYELDSGDDLAEFGRLLSRESWVTTWREHEKVVTGRLWPAIEAVAVALDASTRALTFAEVASIADEPLRL